MVPNGVEPLENPLRVDVPLGPGMMPDGYAELTGDDVSVRMNLVGLTTGEDRLVATIPAPYRPRSRIILGIAQRGPVTEPVQVLPDGRVLLLRDAPSGAEVSLGGSWNV